MYIESGLERKRKKEKKKTTVSLGERASKQQEIGPLRIAGLPASGIHSKLIIYSLLSVLVPFVGE